MYIWNADPHGVASLFAATLPGDKLGSSAPGRKLDFLHKSYFENPPEQPEKQSLDWKEWLHARFRIRRMVPLLSHDKTKLSEDSKYLAKYRPDVFLEFLQSTWDVKILRSNNASTIIHDLLDVPVVCCRRCSEKAVKLRHAYLPLKKLTDLCERFLIEGEFFPFLKINRPLSHGTSPGEWEALGKTFGLGYDEADPVGFLLDLVGEVIKAAEEDHVELHPKRIYDFYLYLQAECRRSNDPEEDREKIWYVSLPPRPAH